MHLAAIAHQLGGKRHVDGTVVVVSVRMAFRALEQAARWRAGHRLHSNNRPHNFISYCFYL